MKRFFLLPALMFSTFTVVGTAQAQFQFSLPGLPNIQLPVPSVSLPGLPFTPGEAVTTSFNDAYPEARWMSDVQMNVQPVTAQSFNVGPGYYRFTLQSYCLHAGTYGPTTGDGYVLAPLKGNQAELIRAVLQRSAQYPNIAQSDVQTLLWGIEAGERFTDYDPAFQVRTAPLLTPAEIARSYVNLPTITPFLPDVVRDALTYYQGLRDELARPNATYQALEALAVLSGTAPLGPGSRTVPSGIWTAAGNGFYARTYPSGYSQTVLELIRAAPYQLVRDTRGRITHFSSGGYIIDTTYNDGDGMNQLPSGSGTVPIWRFATIHLQGPQPGQVMDVRDRGFVLPSSVLRYGTVPTLAPGRTDGVTAPGNVTFNEWLARFQAARTFYDHIADYRGLYGRAAVPPSEQAIADFTDLEHYQDGLRAALEGEGPSWLGGHLLRQRAALVYATCVLSGDCAPPGENPLPDSGTFDPTGLVAAPGNTSMQRLGLSARFR